MELKLYLERFEKWRKLAGFFRLLGLGLGNMPSSFYIISTHIEIVYII